MRMHRPGDRTQDGGIMNQEHAPSTPSMLQWVPRLGEWSSSFRTSHVNTALEGDLHSRLRHEGERARYI